MATWRPGELDDSRQDGQGMGGAMDMVAGVERVVVLVEHTVGMLNPERAARQLRLVEAHQRATRGDGLDHPTAHF